MDIRIFPPDDIIETSIALPRSKSVSNRALIIDALTPGGAEVTGLADCDDTRVMKEILGAGKGIDSANTGPAGTAMRFLTAYFAATEGTDLTIDGNERMRQRPIGPLVDALKAIGADISYINKVGFPPMHIRGHRLRGGEVTVDAATSSQFISALLMIAPVCEEGLTVILDGDPVSQPYIDMTVGMMRRQGIEIEKTASRITVKPGTYAGKPIHVDADWSAASYWYETAALSAGWIDLEGLDPDSLQGDRAVADIFSRICVDTEWDEDTPALAHLTPNPDQSPRLNADLTDNPDIAQTLAVTCCALNIPFRMTGLANLRIKETDRLEALRTELLKASFLVEVTADGLVWDGDRVPVREIPSIDTYGDHRMALAFAPLSIFLPGLEILDCEVVSKSYPDYWKDLAKAGFRIFDSKDIADGGGTEA